MSRILLLMIFWGASTLHAQTISDFENFDIDVAGFLNGSDGSDGFQSGNLFFQNDYNEMYDSWSGWAITNQTDTTTPGFGNQYSAITGIGQGGSANYATSFSFGPNRIELTDNAIGEKMNGMYVTNSTYAYLSVRDGDQFSKKFGGVSGNDPDYFLLTIKGSLNGVTTQDSVNFYLADYRADDNSLDYIVDEWTYIDLKPLGEIDLLLLSLSSTDNGAYGMNTPAFFCVDMLETSDGVTSISSIDENTIVVYPNPASSFVNIEGLDGDYRYEIIDQMGRKILNGAAVSSTSIDINVLKQGLYYIRIWNKEFSKTESLKVE